MSFLFSTHKPVVEDLEPENDNSEFQIVENIVSKEESSDEVEESSDEVEESSDEVEESSDEVEESSDEVEKSLEEQLGKEKEKNRYLTKAVVYGIAHRQKLLEEVSFYYRVTTTIALNMFIDKMIFEGSAEYFLLSTYVMTLLLIGNSDILICGEYMGIDYEKTKNNLSKAIGLK
jgi:hypothetical protein